MALFPEPRPVWVKKQAPVALYSTENHSRKVLSDAADRVRARRKPGGTRLADVAENRLLRLLDPAAAACHVAEAVSHVLPGLREFRQTSEHVALREILLSVAVILRSHAEVLRGSTHVIGIVVVVMMAALAALAALATEETTQQVSSEGKCKTCESEHVYSPFSKGTGADRMSDTQVLAAICASVSK